MQALFYTHAKASVSRIEQLIEPGMTCLVRAVPPPHHCQSKSTLRPWLGLLRDGGGSVYALDRLRRPGAGRLDVLMLLAVAYVNMLLTIAYVVYLGTDPF